MSIKHNIKDLERGLNNAARNQIPFAVSLGINKTLEDVKRNTDKRMLRILDNPTPFTMRAFRVFRSTKRRLTGSVRAQRIQAGYLKWAEEGGTRTPKGQAIVVPVGQRVNKYGNMPRRSIGRLLGRADTFSGSPGGRSGRGGIYKRTKRGLKLMVAYVSRARYSDRLRFVETATKTADARFAVQIERALAVALKTSR
ncbi:hypothetical protein [Roseobacter weihaiensis]|uniref:hypothetical protein n=1 Tax=Roseobacter weihaiensis TaxID=2763262 RepID=UPI001D0B4D40|nr:hypothetical protein [Roseobacter sp. H9]